MNTDVLRVRSVVKVMVAAALVSQAHIALASTESKAAEQATRAIHQQTLKSLPFQDKADFDNARRGLVAELPNGLIQSDDGRSVWDLGAYSFLADKAPDTVNPSLWRQATLNSIQGLFEVAEGTYQVRGLDLANMTIVEGENTLIVIDPLFTVETSRAALELYYQHRPRKPVGTVIYSHGHVDHFGGARGVVSDEKVASGDIEIIAPAHFMESVVAENIIAGNAMSRRMQYQFGSFVPPGPRGSVDGGLGKALPRGKVSLVPPTTSITQETERRVIDGVEIVFHLTLGAEAPSEMIMYFPKTKVLNMAEVATHTMHNLYPLRGAEVRDGNVWAQHINKVRAKFAAKSDIMIAQHHWPTWGTENVNAALEKHRDLYKFMNDQALRLINQGYTPNEISHSLKLPESLAQEWSARGYYGTLSHNVRAVYQKYLGWYDANPANLNPLPPSEASKKAVEYMGGADVALERARKDYQQGNYQWVATVTNQLVFADPSNTAARELGADALEQLGYQAESSMWRSAYLSGARELRDGPPKISGLSSVTPDTVKAVSTSLYFDLLGVRLNAEKAEGKRIVLNWSFTDEDENYSLNLSNSALTHLKGHVHSAADVSLKLSRATLNQIILQKQTFDQAIDSGLIQVEGDRKKISELYGLLDTFNPSFEIVEPKPSASASRS